MPCPNCGATLFEQETKVNGYVIRYYRCNADGFLQEIEGRARETTS